MKIVQVTPVLLYGDGVGNDIVAMDRVLKKQGYDTQIYVSGTVDKRLEHLCQDIQNLSEPEKDDIMIFHMATASDVIETVKNAKCFKVMVYHNITPAAFYEPYNQGAAYACKEGIRQVKELGKYMDYCIPDSKFNEQDLKQMGYECPMSVLPIIIPFEDYGQECDSAAYQKYKDGYTNIVFTGRIAPNKKQEDLIAAFYCYKKYWNPKSRLILVGSYGDEDPYYQSLLAYVNALEVKDVVFTGHISFKAILSCYKAADVFVCMSEHEGFCIPLLEAMHFEKPIIAYGATAVPDTMGQGTMVISEKNPLEVAGLIDYLVKHPELQKQLIENQNERLADFRSEKVEKRFGELIKEIIKKAQSR